MIDETAPSIIAAEPAAMPAIPATAKVCAGWEMNTSRRALDTSTPTKTSCVITLLLLPNLAEAGFEPKQLFGF